MTVSCCVFPGKNLESEQQRQLAEALGKWVQQRPASRHLLESGVHDLATGEPPRPYWIQRMASLDGQDLSEEERSQLGGRTVEVPAEERKRLAEKWGASRHVELTVSEPESLDRKSIVAGLTWDIPRELVDDILIDGVSWNETFDFDLNLYRHDALICHVIPRRDCSPDEFRYLGKAIQQWWTHTRVSARYCRLFEMGVTDLSSGSMPRPVCLQVEEQAREEFTEEYRMAETERQAVFILLGRNLFVQDLVFEGMRRQLPADLIEDVLVDGVSWNG